MFNFNYVIIKEKLKPSSGRPVHLMAGDGLSRNLLLSGLSAMRTGGAQNKRRVLFSIIIYVHKARFQSDEARRFDSMRCVHLP